MIFFTVGEDEDRDVERRGTSHITRREVQVFALVGLVVIVALYWFVILPWQKRADFAASQANLMRLSRALGFYAEANNAGLPPIELAGAVGKPYTWANQLFAYVADKGTFKNATNPQQGNTLLEWRPPDGDPVEVSLSYGMLVSADTVRSYELHDETILLAETLGAGVDGSYNPLPLGGRDGYAIGYDNSNRWPNEETRFVTRLAFRGEGSAPLGLEPLRPMGVAAVRADGSVKILSTAESAFPVGKSGTTPTGMWVPY